MVDDLFGDRLLVIDDEPAFGQVIKKVALDCGFEVVVTADGFELITKFPCEELIACGGKY